jgi:hypothetical protein
MEKDHERNGNQNCGNGSKVTALDQLGIQHFNLVTLDLGTIIGDILFWPANIPNVFAAICGVSSLWSGTSVRRFPRDASYEAKEAPGFSLPFCRPHH